MIKINGSLEKVQNLTTQQNLRRNVNTNTHRWRSDILYLCHAQPFKKYTKVVKRERGEYNENGVMQSMRSTLSNKSMNKPKYL